MSWPTVLLDMNPIEHMWDELGRRVHERPKSPQNLRELGLALQQEWQNIPRRTVRPFTRSMKQRLRFVIYNNVGHTRYPSEFADASPVKMKFLVCFGIPGIIIFPR